MPRQFVSAVFLISLTLLVGCGGGGDPAKTPTAAVKGKVTLDGTPLPKGKIVFDSTEAGKPASEIEVKNGTYEGTAAVGSRTVRILAMRPAKPPAGMSGPGYDNMEENYLPAKYNTASKDVREVKAGGPNEFDFTVTSK